MTQARNTDPQGGRARIFNGDIFGSLGQAVPHRVGLACFVADLADHLGHLGMEHAPARSGVMLTLGVALILFVALNEKKRIVATMRKYYDEARSWE